MLAACDQGTAHDQPLGAGSSIQLLSANVSSAKGLSPNGRIELAFDRLLLPSTIVRQTFVLRELGGTPLTPTIAYDPVARIVTLTPISMLQSDQMLRLDITSPQSATDTGGLRAIDGATLAPSPLCASGSAQPCTIEFPVLAADSGVPPNPPTMDFCKDIFPIFQQCGGGSCHGGKRPAAGLLLDTTTGIASTAIGRVAHGSNTGPRSTSQSVDRLFGVDMPIVDPGTGSSAGGNPGQSWLLYKALLATPSAQSSAQAAACDGGVATPTDVGTAHALAWQPLSDDERSALSNLVLGREMPFPSSGAASRGLTVSELERISRWIAQSASGGAVPSSCDCIP